MLVCLRLYGKYRVCNHASTVRRRRVTTWSRSSVIQVRMSLHRKTVAMRHAVTAGRLEARFHSHSLRLTLATKKSHLTLERRPRHAVGARCGSKAPLLHRAISCSHSPMMTSQSNRRFCLPTNRLSEKVFECSKPSPRLPSIFACWGAFPLHPFRRPPPLISPLPRRPSR